MPKTQEMWDQSLSWEDSLGERNSNPLQYSCLENPMDRGAWWAVVHRIAESQTRLKPLSTHSHTACWGQEVGIELCSFYCILLAKASHKSQPQIRKRRKKFHFWIHTAGKSHNKQNAWGELNLPSLQAFYCSQWYVFSISQRVGS